MKLGIMQPYFFPYIGYFQLLNAVDAFVVYDNIEYSKKGWFNRNRILDKGHDRLFTITLKKDIGLKGAASKAEYETIMNVLKEVKFNKKKAAEVLNIDRKTLYNKLKSYEEYFEQ